MKWIKLIQDRITVMGFWEHSEDFIEVSFKEKNFFITWMVICC